MSPQTALTLGLSFRELGREDNFRDEAIRREVVSRVADVLKWHGLFCDFAGEGRAYGKTKVYIRVHDHEKAMLVARCETELMGVPWVEVMPLAVPGSNEGKVA